MDDAKADIWDGTRTGQIISRFLKYQNIKYTILEHDAAQIDVARRFGSKVFYGDASRKDIVASAGAAEAKIFVLAIDDVTSSIETAKMLRKNFPHLRIVARVRNRQHAIDLMELGITQVFRETYFTSLEVSKRVLLDLGMNESTVDKKIATFRKHDETILQQQSEFRNDEKGMVSYTKRAVEELEKILAADDMP